MVALIVTNVILSILNLMLLIPIYLGLIKKFFINKK